ncbi:MAG TPA: fibronectin type III domain-containing protein, partial [Polyangiaceae bacterium]|nr:fibronectin type III domain-containing protein [Polyangiaceae bacterium]
MHRTFIAARSAAWLISFASLLGCSSTTLVDDDSKLGQVHLRATTAATDYEAENSPAVCQGTIDSDHTGFSGTGFCNTTNAVGAFVEWTVNASAAGSASLTFRYANGTTTDRPADISVNGQVVSAAHSFAGTTNWDTWATQTLNANLVAGSNTVRVTPTTANGDANLDKLTVDAPTDTAAPTTPQNLRSTNVTSNSITLAWDASTDNVGVAAYDIFNDGNHMDEAAGNVTTKTLAGLVPKTTYRLTVFARDAAGNVSASSNQVPVTTSPTSDTTPPTAPGNLTASNVGNSSVTLTWTASTDDVGVTGYDVLAGGTPIITNVQGTSTTVNNLAADTDFTFTVRAK